MRLSLNSVDSQSPGSLQKEGNYQLLEKTEGFLSPIPPLAWTYLANTALEEYGIICSNVL